MSCSSAAKFFSMISGDTGRGVGSDISAESVTSAAANPNAEKVALVDPSGTRIPLTWRSLP
jgi:hypothetical protein